MTPGPSPIAFVTFTTRLNAKHAQEKLKDQPIDPNNKSIHMKIAFAREDTKSENLFRGGREKVEHCQGSNILPETFQKPSKEDEQPQTVESVEQFQRFYHPYVYPFYHPWFQQTQQNYYNSKTPV